MKLAEIAVRITARLERIEADPKLNPWDNGKVNGTRPYYHPYAWVAGRWVYVKYVTYQGSTNLSKAEATRYLAWLDAGNSGKHYKVLKDGK